MEGEKGTPPIELFHDLLWNGLTPVAAVNDGGVIPFELKHSSSPQRTKPLNAARHVSRRVHIVRAVGFIVHCLHGSVVLHETVIAVLGVMVSYLTTIN